MRFLIPVLALCGAAMLASCEKEEMPLELPPPEVQAGSVTDQVTLGADYSTQVFYDFVMEHKASSSAVASWELAFDARAAGARVWMNGGNDVAVFNTGLRNFANVTGLPSGFQYAQWAYDQPSGHADSTGVGEWRDNVQTGASKNDVYIMRVGIQPRYKFQILGVTAHKWTIAWGTVAAQQPFIIDLPKDTAQNYLYFSFRDAAAVQPDPPKADWDVVFTRYRDFVPDNSGVLYPYLVTGVLLNPANTEAATDTGYWENITAQYASTLSFSSARNVIGYDWKKVGTTGGTPNGNYTVNPKKIYIILTRGGKLFKLRFLDFYSQQGEKGSPKFEYQRLK